MKLTINQIKDFVDKPYFSGGMEYYQDGSVKILSITDHKVKAKISGTIIYKVELTLKDDFLDGDCSCPAFENFDPCKHIAATGLAVIAFNKNVSYKVSGRYSKIIDKSEKFEKSLLNKTRNELIEMIVKINDHYPEIIEELAEDEDDYYD